MRQPAPIKLKRESLQFTPQLCLQWPGKLNKTIIPMPSGSTRSNLSGEANFLWNVLPSNAWGEVSNPKTSMQSPNRKSPAGYCRCSNRWELFYINLANHFPLSTIKIPLSMLPSPSNWVKLSSFLRTLINSNNSRFAWMILYHVSNKTASGLKFLLSEHKSEWKVAQCCLQLQQKFPKSREISTIQKDLSS